MGCAGLEAWAERTRGRGDGWASDLAGGVALDRLFVDSFLCRRSRDGVARSFGLRRSEAAVAVRLSRDGDGLIDAGVAGLSTTGSLEKRGMPLGRRLWRLSSMLDMPGLEREACGGSVVAVRARATHRFPSCAAPAGWEGQRLGDETTNWS